MGQKTNSIIFRLGNKHNEWNSKYFEQNKEESNLYSYQNIQIQTYLKKILKTNGLFVQKSKLHYNKNNLYVFISYFSTKKTSFLITKKKTNQVIQLKAKKAKKFKKFKKFKTNLKLFSFLKTKKSQKTKKNRIRRVHLLKKYKRYLYCSRDHMTNEYLVKNNFTEQILESLSLFTKKKFHIFLVFQNINRGNSLKFCKDEQKKLKKQLLVFRKYFKKEFFKESLNIVYVSTRIKNSAGILSKFLAQQITFLKRHNYFLVFFKTLLNYFIKSKFSKVKGIKILINGRFNGAPRAKTRLITIGDIPIQTISNTIDYFQATSYTKNGTFGVKVWIH